VRRRCTHPLEAGNRFPVGENGSDAVERARFGSLLDVQRVEDSPEADGGDETFDDERHAGVEREELVDDAGEEPPERDDTEPDGEIAERRGARRYAWQE
jgi:hypothetical protein